VRWEHAETSDARRNQHHKCPGTTDHLLARLGSKTVVGEGCQRGHHEYHRQVIGEAAHFGQYSDRGLESTQTRNVDQGAGAGTQQDQFNEDHEPEQTGQACHRQ
jgi:hypothetical protein